MVGIVLLFVFVDNNDYVEISSNKTILHTKFHTEDLGQLKYLLGVLVMRSEKGIYFFKESMSLIT